LLVVYDSRPWLVGEVTRWMALLELRDEKLHVGGKTQVLKASVHLARGGLALGADFCRTGFTLGRLCVTELGRQTI
jgi:hypothetical protein